MPLRLDGSNLASHPQYCWPPTRRSTGTRGRILPGLPFVAYSTAAGVDIRESCPVRRIELGGAGFQLETNAGTLVVRRLVLAGGAWLGGLLGLLGVEIAVKALVNQLAVTERLAPVMRSVLTIANGLLSLKQFANGTVLIGGGWQGRGDLVSGETAIIEDNLYGNLRLAAWTVPRLRVARVVRIWLGFEAETRDAMPLVGPVPGVPGAFVIGAGTFRLHQRPLYGTSARPNAAWRGAGAAAVRSRPPAPRERNPERCGCMSPVEGQFFHGIYPSILCPFRPDLTIDTEALAAHAESLAATPGIRGILCNGHAGESAVLSRGEKYRVVEVVRRAIGRKAVLVAGIGQEESGEAAAEGHDAVVAGADAVMVLAPFSWALGHDPEMVDTASPDDRGTRRSADDAVPGFGAVGPALLSARDAAPIASIARRGGDQRGKLGDRRLRGNPAAGSSRGTARGGDGLGRRAFA